jgi:hypothetical protein
MGTLTGEMTMNEASRSGAPLIFLHMPKTGGTTLRAVLERIYGPGAAYGVYGRAFGFHDLDDFMVLSRQERGRIRLLMGHMYFGLHGEMPAPCLYLTMLRNPVDRLISQFHHMATDPSHPFNRVIVEQGMGLAGYLASGRGLREDNHQSRADNLQTRFISGMRGVPHGGSSRRMLELAKRNIREHFLLAGITERFDESLVLMKRALGWPEPCYRRLNESSGRPRREDLSPDDLRAVEQCSALDMELYGYALGLLEERIAGGGPGFAEEVRAFRQGCAGRAGAGSP